VNKQDVLDQHLVSSFDDPSLARDAILRFANSRLHYDDEHRYERNFYGRRLRPHVLKFLEFSSPADSSSIRSYSALSANRALAAMYETDFLLLPGDSGRFVVADFAEFYDPNRRTAASIAIPFLEKFLFDFLRQEVRMSGQWNLPKVQAYFSDYASTVRKENTLPSAGAIATAKEQVVAAKDWLLQLAPDFLLESSPMARYANGSFGALGSNLFKIIIDELGYGDFRKKHSTLFEDMLRSAGLETAPHAYWQYYLNGSLLLSNYYNMLTRDKRYFFRYVGAIYLAETGFISACALWRETLRSAIPTLDTRYFDEHCHIDVDHSRMAFEGLVRPAIEQYGEWAAQEVVRGFEEAKWLGRFAEDDFVAQVRWKDDAGVNKEGHDKILASVINDAEQGLIQSQTFVEPFDELSITHTHDEDELCHINSGTMEFLNGYGKSTILRQGEGIVIHRNRLHGALIQSDVCDYTIYNIKDASRWG
jgi:quercetin dioxygenase-like cupin family protein